MSNAEVTKIDAWKVNTYAFSLYKKYFLPIVLLGCIYGIFSFLLDAQAKSVLVNPSISPTFLFESYIVSPLVSVILDAILLWFLNQQEQGIKSNLFASFTHVFPRLIYIVIAQFLVLILISIGFFLLIIPGIILAVMFSQVETSMVIKGQKIKEAFSSSRQLTRGKYWFITRSYLTLYIPAILLFALINYFIINKFVPGFVPVIQFLWNALISGWLILITYSIWKNLLPAEQTTNPTPDTNQPAVQN